LRASGADAKKISENVPRGKTQRLRSDYMAAPANALAVGGIGANKGKLILAARALDEIIIMGPTPGRSSGRAHHSMCSRFIFL
jgi:hypothetical protein